MRTIPISKSFETDDASKIWFAIKRKIDSHIKRKIDNYPVTEIEKDYLLDVAHFKSVVKNGNF